MSEPSLWELLEEFTRQFKAENAPGLKEGEVQLLVHGREPLEAYWRLQGGRCTLHRGKVDFPLLTLEMDGEVLRDLITGRLTWQDALMTRKFIATGNTTLLGQLAWVFSWKF